MSQYRLAGAHLKYDDLSDAGAKTLAETSSVHIAWQELYLHNNGISAAGAKDLAEAW